MVFSFDKIANHISLSIDGELFQVYPMNNSTFTIKNFSEEKVSPTGRTQWRLYMHILGIDPAYYSHVGIDIYSTATNNVEQILVDGSDYTDNHENLVVALSVLYSA
jgi:hypothetical protein